MSVYSRWVEARGTITIESTPADRQSSKPVASSRRGSGAWVGDETPEGSKRPELAKYGATVNPYSDCSPSAGTTGVSGPSASNSSSADEQPPHHLLELGPGVVRPGRRAPGDHPVGPDQECATRIDS